MFKGFKVQMMLRLLLLFMVGSGVVACWPPPETDEEVSEPLVLQPPDEITFENQQALLAAEPLERDLIDLAARFRGVPDPTGAPVNHADRAGGIQTFRYLDRDRDVNTALDAVLAHTSPMLNMWVDTAAEVDAAKLEAAAAHLEATIIPTTRAFFGQERSPGIDQDPRLNILHVANIGGSTLGYFSSSDSLPRAVAQFSNQREMLYINLALLDVGSDAYFATIAHELEHMIHYNNDSNEDTWIDEGMAEVSAQLSGYGVSQHAASFLRQPDTQLTYFEYESPDYGASYLFSTYFLDRFGQEATRSLVRDEANGAQGVADALRLLNTNLGFDDLFADWVVTNYVASRGLGRDHFQYREIELPAEVEPTFVLAAGEERLTAVHQYAADYISIAADAPITVNFIGTQQTYLLDTTPFSGDFFVSTLPADDSDMTLTRSFDLSGLITATLQFQTWYDIELGWDYAYVTVSTDGGARWTPLQTISSNNANPHGNNLGNGYTGTSGSVEPPVWRQESADLTPFIPAGEVLIRFEYVTDDAVHEQGFAVDDIALLELGYFEDFESEAEGWEMVGFVRHANDLPQTFLVQQLLLAPDGSFQVARLPLAGDQSGRWEIPLNGNNEAILIVSALNPLSIHPASYRIAVDG